MTVLNWSKWFKLLCSTQCTDLATALTCLKLLRCWKEKMGLQTNGSPWKNIVEPNPHWSSEFMCIGINYYEDQCNSIELQAIELSGACVHVCVVFVCCGGMYIIISFRLPTWEDRGSVGMLQIFHWVAWHVYNVYSVTEPPKKSGPRAPIDVSTDLR